MEASRTNICPAEKGDIGEVQRAALILAVFKT